MEPENRISQLEAPHDEAGLTFEPLAPTPKYRGLRWAFIGDQGLRAGWSVALFILLAILFLRTLGSVASFIFRNHHHASTGSFSPLRAIVGEVVEVLAFLGAGALVALIERRRVVDYNLTGPRRFVHFLSGLAAGFAALSALVGALAWGGWVHFGPVCALWSADFRLWRAVGRGLSSDRLQRGRQLPLLPAIHPDARNQLLVGAGHRLCHLRGFAVDGERQRHLGRLLCRAAGAGALPVAAPEKSGRLRLLAGGLGHARRSSASCIPATAARTG